jgi:hypothetical protein
MVDPVMNNEGHSFERSYIETWLEKNQTSPITGTYMTANELRPNIALRNAIADAAKEAGIALNSVPPKKTHFNNQDLELYSMTGGDVKHYCLNIKAGSGTRTPTDLCCVVDISGSMDTLATIKTEDGSSESYGMTILDVVKHALLTIIEIMDENDTLSIIVFSEDGRTLMNPKKMNARGKEKARSRVETIRTEGRTNLWDGISKGLTMVNRSTYTNRALFVLTDGIPNVIPPKGNVQTLKEKNTSNIPVHTFGFGYNLLSKELTDLAAVTHSTYNFIPDSSFVGTIFVNSVANLLSVQAPSITVKIDGADFCLTGDTAVFPNGSCLKIGSLRYGQDRQIVVTTSSKSTPNFTVSYNDVSMGSVEMKKSGDATISNDEFMNYTTLRSRLIATVMKNVTDVSNYMVPKDNEEGIRREIDNLISSYPDYSHSTNSFIKGLYDDIVGQIKEATSRNDWYNKWGRHFLLSIANAHGEQVCNNFKDPGVQAYGGLLFKKLVDAGSDIFTAIKPPKPSRKSHTGATIASMRTYYNASGPCFTANSQIAMANGYMKNVGDVVKGDELLNGYRVVCVVKTLCKDNVHDMVILSDGMVVSPYHPVKQNGRWVFPNSIKNATNVDTDAIYNFVLDRGHVVTVGGVEACTLAHGFNDNYVIKHNYFGTQKVVEDLMNMQGWNNGLVVLPHGCTVRDPDTKMVVGLKQ